MSYLSTTSCDSIYFRFVNKSLTWCLFYRFIAILGVLAVVVQYDAAPKYCVFAFSIVESEDTFLKWVFGAHEVIFLAHAWLVYGSVIYISSAMGAEFTYNIETLQEVLESIAKNSPNLKRRKRFSRGLSVLSANQLISHEVASIELMSKLKATKYSPFTLVKDYVHLRMIVTELNRFAAYNFLYMHACSYIQMISDVFQLIQILRMPEASLMDAIFFAEDM